MSLSIDSFVTTPRLLTFVNNISKTKVFADNFIIKSFNGKMINTVSHSRELEDQVTIYLFSTPINCHCRNSCICVIHDCSKVKNISDNQLNFKDMLNVILSTSK